MLGLSKHGFPLPDFAGTSFAGMTFLFENDSRIEDSTTQTPRDAMPERVEHSLPAWLYTDSRFFEAERDHLFARAPHLVCHVNDIPEPGDYHTLDILGEKFFSVRGADHVVRSFHNVCRHRASRLAGGESGNCGHRLVCPYHAWSYTLDGALKSTPPWQGFDDLDRSRYGLVPLEQEIWRGFVFVRAETGAPSVGEMMAPYEHEIALHDFENLVPQGRVTLRPRAVNWKNAADNYGDGLHIPVAHPGLTRLFAGSYTLEAKQWVDKMEGRITERPSTNRSERLYQSLLPIFDHLPAERRRIWSYYRLWPNLAFDVYPDQLDFMQFIPISPATTLIREIGYVRADPRREAKLARHLNWRINRQVNREDTALIAGVQAGMSSSSYASGPLSKAEICLAAFARRLREALPQAAFEAPGDVGEDSLRRAAE
jgi:phenylpropionate dioxygenase-like ring-hydroxylating dioxygenase large terminal subunit